MIISHRHKFIFIKTRKTAGSSIEMYLRPFLGPDDVATGSIRDDYPAMNCDPLTRGHLSIQVAKEWYKDDSLKDYTSFAFERHPYDKVLSEYVFQKDHREFDKGLDTYIEFYAPILNDLKLYTSGGTVVVNHLLRFEQLTNGMDFICSKIGISWKPDEFPHLKSTSSEKPTLSDRHKQIIDTTFKWQFNNMYTREEV